MAAKRGQPPPVASPMRVGDDVIRECRRVIDGRTKKFARKIINFCHKWRDGIAEVGEGVQFGKHVRVPTGSRLGHYCYIGAGFYSPSPVCIGDLSMLSTSVRIVGADHGIDNPERPTRLDFRWKHNITIIGADAWLGHDVVLKAGITIGLGSVVAAGSIVTKNVPPNTIVGGNPAKVIRERFNAADWSVYIHKLGIDQCASQS
jgi:acetyltransferase-like isoleucine patch superfamily enzyme